MEWFYSLPIAVAELGAVLIAVLIGVGLHVLVQRTVPYTRLAKHNDVAGFIFSMVGVIYAVVLGFVVVVVWERHDVAIQNAQAEESSVSDMYRIVGALPKPFARAVRSDIRTYATLMVEQEWPSMRRGSESRQTQLQGEDLAYRIEGFQPKGEAQSNIHAAALALLQKFLDARRERLRENQGSVVPILWWTLFVGGFATVGFTYFFGTENKRMQLAMTAVIAALLATMYVLVAEFDRPFAGRIAVPAEIWSTFLHDRVPEIR